MSMQTLVCMTARLTTQSHFDSHSDFLSNILFTNEYIFRLNGHVNSRNVRIQAQRGLLNEIKYLCTVRDSGIMQYQK